MRRALLLTCLWTLLLPAARDLAAAEAPNRVAPGSAAGRPAPGPAPSRAAPGRAPRAVPGSARGAAASGPAPSRAAPAARMAARSPAAVPAAAAPAADDPAAAALRPAAFDDIPGWDDDAPLESLPVVLATCRHLAQLTPERALGGSGEVAALGGTPAAWRDSCAALARAWAALPSVPSRPPRNRAERRTAAELLARRATLAREALETTFVAHAAGEGLLTGYFEPILRGALGPGHPPYSTPLHARPPELLELVEPPGRGGGAARRSWGARPPGGGRLEPLPDRAAIEGGALDGRGLELAWVDDAAAAFFLHVQGSGRVVLPNGAVLRLGYAGQNGQPYRPIGRSLIERGALTREQMSMRAITEWMRAAGPEAAAALRRENPSYIFFRRNEGLRDDQGPPGALGIPLVPERSIAVDPAFIPLGAPVFVAPFVAPLAAVEPAAEAPAAPARGARRAAPRPPPPPPRLAARLTVAQDTGGAIRGAARGDLFRGWGDAAGERAGNLRDRVLMWVLLPRPAVPPEAPGPVTAASGER